MVAEMYFVEQATRAQWEELVESMRQLALERRHVYVVVGRLEDGFYVVVQDFVEPEVEQFAWMVRNGGGGDLGRCGVWEVEGEVGVEFWGGE